MCAATLVSRWTPLLAEGLCVVRTRAMHASRDEKIFRRMHHKAATFSMDLSI
jgi:hypothetical protein